MATKSVNFDTQNNLIDTHLETVAKWLSCNGEVWGVGPTLVFASAAALFLYNELKNTVFIGGDQIRVYMLEKSLISTMILGMLALMIHLWVCSMRFFQYYLDTIIKDSPGMLLEMTTAGLLGGKADILALGPLTRFLRTQQPQIHITVCWFLSLCYADYVRKNYCQRFNMPYLEQWQTELHERAVRSVNSTVARVNSFVGSVQQRLRGFMPTEQPRVQECLRGCRQDCRQYCQQEARPDAHRITVRAQLRRDHRSWYVPPPVPSSTAAGPHPACWTYTTCRSSVSRRKSSTGRLITNRARQQCKPLRNSEITFKRPDVPARVHRSPASLVLCLTKPSLEDCPWRNIAKLPYDTFLQ